MKKLIFCALALGVLVGGGCNKDDAAEGTVQIGGESHNVTSAVVNVYERASGKTNLEIYLLLDGTDWNSAYYGEGDSGAFVYFDLYFDGEQYELPEGNYQFSENEGVFQYGDYIYYSEENYGGSLITSGTLSVGKDGDNYSIRFNGMSSLYDPETDDFTGDSIEFSCSYTGPVTFVGPEDENEQVVPSSSKKMRFRR